MGLKVFISYPRELAREAERWKTELEASLGESAVFVCHVSIPELERAGRADQRRALQAEIQDADAFVVFLHRDYSRAAWCGWELTSALRTTKPVFVVNFDERIQADLFCQSHEFFQLTQFQHGDNKKNRAGASGARFVNLECVVHEVFAQHR